MTILALYPTKKDLKASVGKSLMYRETSAFGPEYKHTGTFSVAGRPHLTPVVQREFFATVVMVEGKISQVS